MSTTSTEKEIAFGQFDVVALKQELHRTDITESFKSGTQGTIVDILPGGVYEIEFSDSFGNTEYIAYLEATEVELKWSYTTDKRQKREVDALPLEQRVAEAAIVEMNRKQRDAKRF